MSKVDLSKCPICGATLTRKVFPAGWVERNCPIHGKMYAYDSTGVRYEKRNIT